MKIGKQLPYSAISTSDAHSLTIRGKDLCSELVGKTDFVSFYYFLLTGEDATPVQSLFINATLIAIAEHGLTPTVQAARMTYDAEPNAIQAAVAAGILGAGSIVMGSSEVCGKLLHRIVQQAADTTRPIDEVAREVLTERKARNQTIPGFGHPQHTEGDPRCARLFELAEQHDVHGPYIQALRALENHIPNIYNKSLPVNVSGAIPAILLDVGFPLKALKGIPILARTAGILAHLHEEAERPIGFLMYHHADAAITYDGPRSVQAKETAK